MVLGVCSLGSHSLGFSGPCSAGDCCWGGVRETPNRGGSQLLFSLSPLDTWEAPLSVGRFPTRDSSRESLLLIISPTVWSLTCFYLFCPAWEIIPTNFQGVLKLRWSWDCSLKKRKGKSFPNLCIQAFQKCLPSQKRISGGDKK